MRDISTKPTCSAKKYQRMFHRRLGIMSSATEEFDNFVLIIQNAGHPEKETSSKSHPIVKIWRAVMNQDGCKSSVDTSGWRQNCNSHGGNSE